jgi:hypothetical protein
MEAPWLAASDSARIAEQMPGNCASSSAATPTVASAITVSRFRGTERAAERQLARLVAEQEAVPAVMPEEGPRTWGPTTTLNDALAAWQANGWEDLSPYTTKRYQSLWDVHIRDDIGRRRIASLSSYDLERWYRELKRSGQGQSSGALSDQGGSPQ